MVVDFLPVRCIPQLCLFWTWCILSFALCGGADSLSTPVPCCALAVGDCLCGPFPLSFGLRVVSVCRVSTRPQFPVPW
jgi:hypothetical protein